MCLVTITSSSLSPGCFISLLSAQTRSLLYRVLHEQNVAQVAKITRRLGHHVVGLDSSLPVNLIEPNGAREMSLFY